MSYKKIRNSFILFVCFLFLLPGLIANAADNNVPSAPQKPKIDQTNQVFLTLANGLHVLIISDPAATQSMVAVNVAAGGYRDPQNFIGLSHFLEHAVFMGSKNFPDGKGLFDYVNFNGGLINANTTDSGTTYFLRLEINALPEALNRLSDALAQPLLTAKNSLGELNNVEAEYVANLHQFPRQYSDAMAQAVYNPNHPISRQPRGGNLRSLHSEEQEKLMTALRSFHQRYYSANLMNAVIYSKIPLPVLTELAGKYLTRIPNRQVQLTPITAKRIVNKEKILHLNTKDQGKLIVITFTVPKLKNNFAAFSYVDFLLQNMQPGSAYDLLYKNNLISSLSTNSEVTYLESEDEFNIYLELTDKGVKQQDLIVNTVFNYLDLIRSRGVTDAYFKQLQKTLAINFDNRKPDYSLERIALLSTLMQELPAAKLYNYYLIPPAMHPAEIKATLKYLTLNNVNITYSSAYEPYQKSSEYYQAKYALESFNGNRFGNRKITENFAGSLKLPPLNQYIADNFTINNPKTITRAAPSLLANPYGALLYSMPSSFFKDNPNVYLNIILTSPTVLKRPQDYILPLLTDIIFFKKYLGEFSQYNLSGINWSYDFIRGQNLFLVGVPQHMLSLTKNFLSRFKTFTFDNPEVLAAAKIQLQRQISEKRGSMGALDSAFEVTDVFIPDFIDDTEVLPAIAKVTLADLNRYHQGLISRHKLKILSVGNLNDGQIAKFAYYIEQIFPDGESAYPRQYAPKLATQKLAYLKKVKNANNALVMLYYLPRLSYLENIIYARFISNIFNDIFFNELRTKLHLGYTVGIGEVNLTAQYKALAFFIESPDKSPRELYPFIRDFNLKAVKALETMPKEVIEHFKLNITTNLIGIPQDMNDEFSEHNTDFMIENTGMPVFKRLEAINKNIHREDLVGYFKDAIVNEKGVVILSEVTGNKKDKNKDTIIPAGFTNYNSLQDLHKAIRFEPFTLPAATYEKGSQKTVRGN